MTARNCNKKDIYFIYIYTHCQLKEEALDRTTWRNRFGRGFGPVVWQITDDDYIYIHISAVTDSISNTSHRSG